MRRLVKARQNQIESSDAMINLTPLIDVVFVMLIMFIVVAPILELDQIELARAGQKSQEVSATIQETSPILIHVKRDNSIFVNKQPVDPIDLSPLLKNLKTKYPNAIPLLFQDKKALFGTYQDVKNRIESCGFTEINILLAP